MNIDKAIEILTLRAESPFVRANQDTKDAIKLGIEAMKHIQRQRKDLMWSEWKPLPGESVS